MTLKLEGLRAYLQVVDVAGRSPTLISNETVLRERGCKGSNGRLLQMFRPIWYLAPDNDSRVRGMFMDVG